MVAMMHDLKGSINRDSRHYKSLKEGLLNSQKDFLDSNSNSINSRILLLKKLLINIKLFEEEIYEALSKDLNKAKFGWHLFVSCICC